MYVYSISFYRYMAIGCVMVFTGNAQTNQTNQTKQLQSTTISAMRKGVDLNVQPFQQRLRRWTAFWTMVVNTLAYCFDQCRPLSDLQWEQAGKGGQCPPCSCLSSPQNYSVYFKFAFLQLAVVLFPWGALLILADLVRISILGSLLLSLWSGLLADCTLSNIIISPVGDKYFTLCCITMKRNESIVRRTSTIMAVYITLTDVGSCTCSVRII